MHTFPIPIFTQIAVLLHYFPQFPLSCLPILLASECGTNGTVLRTIKIVDFLSEGWWRGANIKHVMPFNKGLFQLHDLTHLNFFPLIVIQRDTTFESTRVIDSATTQLTKTAITVTSIFIICLGYECWNYTLGELGVVTYQLGSPVQKVSPIFSLFRGTQHLSRPE